MIHAINMMHTITSPNNIKNHAPPMLTAKMVVANNTRNMINKIVNIIIYSASFPL